MNEIELRYAWAAGFLDGEGCITLGATSPSKYTWNPIVSVCQTHPEPLDELAALFGGKVKLRSYSTSAGTPVYIWVTNGAVNTSNVLEKVLPYLVLKRRQAEIVLEYCKTVGYQGHVGVPNMVFARRRHLVRRLHTTKST
jgi:hypothetical protein